VICVNTFIDSAYFKCNILVIEINNVYYYIFTFVLYLRYINFNNCHCNHTAIISLRQYRVDVINLCNVSCYVKCTLTMATNVIMF